MTNTPCDAAAVLVAPLSHLTPCGPCCSLNDDWQSVPRGVHASALDADETVEYWVYATDQDDEGFTEEHIYRLTIGTGAGSAADMIQCWLNQYLPSAVLQNYARWGLYLNDWHLENSPF